MLVLLFTSTIVLDSCHDNILQDVEAKLEAAEELHKTVGFAELYEYADTDPSAHPKELLKLACRPKVQQS